MIGPNASLTERQAWVCMGLAGLACGGIAIGFAALGYWPVLSFAGLELAAVATALYVSMRRNRYREVVTVRGDRVRIEVGFLGRGASSMTELPRSWARVAVEPGIHRNDPTRLLLMCSGQRVEIGRCLTDSERERLAARLRELLTSRREALEAPGERDPAQ